MLNQSRRVVMTVSANRTVVPKSVETGDLPEGLRVIRPALCAVLFKEHDAHQATRPGFAGRLLRAGFDRFNSGFESLSAGYGNVTRRLLRGMAAALVIYVGRIGLQAWNSVAR